MSVLYQTTSVILNVTLFFRIENFSFSLPESSTTNIGTASCNLFCLLMATIFPVAIYLAGNVVIGDSASPFTFFFWSFILFFCSFPSFFLDVVLFAPHFHPWHYFLLDNSCLLFYCCLIITTRLVRFLFILFYSIVL